MLPTAFFYIESTLFLRAFVLICFCVFLVNKAKIRLILALNRYNKPDEKANGSPERDKRPCEPFLLCMGLLLDAVKNNVHCVRCSRIR